MAFTNHARTGEYSIVIVSKGEMGIFEYNGKCPIVHLGCSTLILSLISQVAEC